MHDAVADPNPLTHAFLVVHQWSFDRVSYPFTSMYKYLHTFLQRPRLTLAVFATLYRWTGLHSPIFKSSRDSCLLTSRPHRLHAQHA